MESMSQKIVQDGITFDDVLLIPGYSEVLPRAGSVGSQLTKSIRLNIPILSAAMDTVSESDMAIALAREGGLGILHKNMDIPTQVGEVDRVKRFESGMIRKPITLTAEKTVQDAIDLMSRFRISGIPVIDEDRRLIGIITNRDLRFEPNRSQLIGDLMTKDRLVTAPESTTLEDAEDILQNHKIEKLPVVDKDYILRGLITFKDIQKKKKYPNACKDEHGRLRVGAAVGLADNTLDRVNALYDAGVDVIAVDTAHGHTIGVINMVKNIKAQHPDLQVIAGNVATEEGTQALIDAGADCIKVGIGPGSICTTRVVAGVGVPQISAIMNARRAAKKAGIPVIADGGIKQSGDIAKAFAAGADVVMIGNLLAGHEESPGRKIQMEGRAYKVYRGMGSLGAMQQGSADRYFQADVEDEIAKLVPEGIEGRVPYKGSVSETIYQLVGGLRAAMHYCGCSTITDMQDNAQFSRMTSAGLRESHPHDVTVTKESPNYYVPSR
jgi:IMP dehydrogenase